MISTLAGPMKRDIEDIEASIDTTEAVNDEEEADVTDVSEEETEGLERAATFGHYAHVYGAGKEGQDRKEKDEAEQNAAAAEEAAQLAAAEESSRSWQYYGGFPPPGPFHQHQKQGQHQDHGSLQPPPGWPKGLPFPPQMPQNPNQESGPFGFQQNPTQDQGQFQQNPNQGQFQQNPKQGQGQFRQNPNHEPFQQIPNYGQNQMQQNPNRGGSNSFPAPGFLGGSPPWYPTDQPFPPQMPMEGAPGSDSHTDMFSDPGMFEDMAFMDDQKSGMPAGFPAMMEHKSGMPPRFPPMMDSPFMGPGSHCPKVCDLTAYPACSCLHPAAFTKDGRGNCNVGSLKPDLQVWCYVDPDKGDPRMVCPDSKKSTTKKGYYWSRFACITE